MFLSPGLKVLPSNFTYEMSIESIPEAPITIRAVSFCIFSNSLTSYYVEMSHTTSAYTRDGLIKEVYIISSDFLSN